MFPFLEIKHYRDLDKNILPKIDALAAAQNRTRSDVIRDILYTRFGYIPLSRSQDKINEDLIKERQEGKSVQHRCIIVRVDEEYKDLFFKYILTQPGRLDQNYRSYLNQTLYHYFDMAVPRLLH
jgi:predicted transcriptional regulator